VLFPPRHKPLRLLYPRTSKSAVRATDGSDVHELQQRIQNGFETIRTAQEFETIRTAQEFETIRTAQEFETIRTAQEFSSESGDHRSDVQRHASKIKVDTVSIFFVFLRS